VLVLKAVKAKYIEHGWDKQFPTTYLGMGNRAAFDQFVATPATQAA
jgi:hypothetical protein